MHHLFLMTTCYEYYIVRIWTFKTIRGLGLHSLMNKTCKDPL